MVSFTNVIYKQRDGVSIDKWYYDRSGKETIRTINRIRKVKILYDIWQWHPIVSLRRWLQNKFNPFHKNLRFTMGYFEDNNAHSCKTLRIKLLYHRTRKMCLSTEKFKCQIDNINLFMPWICSPLHTCNSFIT